MIKYAIVLLQEPDVSLIFIKDTVKYCLNDMKDSIFFDFVEGWYHHEQRLYYF